MHSIKLSDRMGAYNALVPNRDILNVKYENHHLADVYNETGFRKRVQIEVPNPKDDYQHSSMNVSSEKW
jgi:hypothetical protein